MNYLDLIEQLDNKPNNERLEIIIQQLKTWNVDYRIHEYKSGVNLFVDLGVQNKRIGISSHYDRVQVSPGANDNGSAIAVCLDIIKRFKGFNSNGVGLRVFFFDEEETGLRGSSAYVNEFGIKDLIGLINMELVGMGDKFALWPVHNEQQGKLLRLFELAATKKRIASKRYTNIITNTADHQPFQNAGLKDVFTITCISQADIEVANHYFKAIEFAVDKQTLFEILSNAPIFKNYHKPSDSFDKLSEDSIVMTSSTIWDIILGFHISEVG